MERYGTRGVSRQFLANYLANRQQYVQKGKSVSSKKTVNSELKKVKIWCDVNRNSINFSKTNFMIIKSPKKKDGQVNINIESAEGTINVLQRKQQIKDLGVLLDETISFTHRISYNCTRIARNNGIMSKLRHYLTLLQMKQIYYSLIYPYISTQY